MIDRARSARHAVGSAFVSANIALGTRADWSGRRDFGGSWDHRRFNDPCWRPSRWRDDCDDGRWSHSNSWNRRRWDNCYSSPWALSGWWTSPSWGFSSGLSIGFASSNVAVSFSSSPICYSDPWPRYRTSYCPSIFSYDPWPCSPSVVYVPTYSSSYVYLDAPAYSSDVLYDEVTAVLPSAPAPAPASEVYSSDALTGVLAFGQTPSVIVAAVRSAGARAERAGDFLGRVPAGAWEAVYEGQRTVDARSELFFRANDANSRGHRALVIVRVSGAVEPFEYGDAVQVTGRLAEISVDDPREPGGRLLLEDGAVRR